MRLEYSGRTPSCELRCGSLREGATVNMSRPEARSDRTFFGESSGRVKEE